ncbi:MAG: hypothetical protein ACFFA7_11835 [Promethearchaeota archaeon]
MNEYFLILLVYGLLIVSLMLIVFICIEQIKKESNESLVIFIIISIAILLLIPVIIGVTKDLNL